MATKRYLTIPLNDASVEVKISGPASERVISGSDEQINALAQYLLNETGHTPAPPAAPSEVTE